MPNIRLKWRDGRFLDVDGETAKGIAPLASMLENLGSGDDQETIDFNSTAYDVMQKVVKWVEHHRNDPPPSQPEENEERRTLHLSKWDEEFLKVDLPTMYDLITAADFLEVHSLLDATCNKIAEMIKSKTTEELREIFNIEKDLTPEDEEQLRQEAEWCMQECSENRTTKELLEEDLMLEVVLHQEAERCMEDDVPCNKDAEITGETTEELGKTSDIEKDLTPKHEEEMPQEAG